MNQNGNLLISDLIADAGFVVDCLLGLLQLSTKHHLGLIGLVQLVGCLVRSVNEIDLLLL